MNWNTLISAKRFGLEEFHQERHENRSEFQRDYDRLVFSAPFRRLQNKTQVFPLHLDIDSNLYVTDCIYSKEGSSFVFTHSLAT